MRPSLLATTKRRRSRITPRQAAALTGGSPRLARPDQDSPDIDPAALTHLLDRLDPGTAWVLDIGFGTGDPVEQAARAEPGRSIIAVDLHTPGIGDLVHRIESGDIRNVVVIEADARAVVTALPPKCLDGVRTYFPDPWPKKRHHRRRLVNPPFAEDVATRVRTGGFWHLATDWADYADQMQRVLTASGRWHGGVIPRPPARPLTRYESHALSAGRAVTDLWFERIGP